MSHFSILVVGDVDYQMAPFHEYECDGINDKFVVDVEVSREEILKSYEKYDNKDEQGNHTRTLEEFMRYWYGNDDTPVLESVDEINTDKEEQKWGYFLKDGDTLRYFRHTNPNSFYDYYGNGYDAFKLKNSDDWVNHAKKKDIDFDAMFDIKEQKARTRYRLAISYLGGTPTLEHTWASLAEKFSPSDGSEPTMTKDVAKVIYDSQEFVKKWDKIPARDRMDLVGIFGGVDEFCCTEDEYVASQSIHALSFGWVRNRKYVSNGDMGWWACVSNEKEPTSWDEEYKKFIESLPENVELTILDCHV